MEETLQPYEILATDAIGKPTFIDFISTKVKSDDKFVYGFLRKILGFKENTTFLEKPNSYVLQNGIHSKKLFQFYKGIDKEGNLFTLQLPKKMKNLILCVIAFLFLFTSCFEKEEEVTVVPTEDGNVGECEKYKKFVEFVTTNPPRTPRSTIKKYSYNNAVVYLFEIGMYENSAEHFYSYVIDSQCNLICDASPPAVDEQGLFCLDWNEKAVFAKTVWQDNR